MTVSDNVALSRTRFWDQTRSYWHPTRGERMSKKTLDVFSRVEGSPIPWSPERCSTATAFSLRERHMYAGVEYTQGPGWARGWTRNLPQIQGGKVAALS